MKKSGQLVFIDDSGDPGFKKGVSSSNFVLAAALFMDSETATLVNDAISMYRKSLGWRDEAEFKFRKTNKQIIKQVLKMACGYDLQIYVVYINKVDYSGILGALVSHERLYNFATKDLLSLMPLDGAVVKIDGKYNKTYRRYMRAFIRRELNAERPRVADFDASDSKKDNLIQLADLIVGSINRSLQAEKTDADQYLNIIRKKIIILKNLGTDGDEGKKT